MELNSSYIDDLERLNKRKIKEYAGAIAYTLFVIVFGMLGNIMSVMFYGFKVPRTSTNVIITGLATVDLIACVLFSDEIIELCFTVTFKNKPGCKLMYFSNHWLVLTSGFMLLFVAIDRFRKICRPFAWQFSIKSAQISFFIIVIAALVHSVRDLYILEVVKVNVTEAKSGKTIEAFYCTHSKDPGLNTAISLFHTLDLLTFIIVIGGCIILYVLISRTLLVSRKHIKHTYKGEESLTDVHQEGTSTWYIGALSTGETAFYDTQSDIIANNTAEFTTKLSCVPFTPDKFSIENIDLNADPCNILPGDIALVEDMNKIPKRNSHVEDKPSDAQIPSKHVSFKGDNDPRKIKHKRHNSKRTKQYHIERNVTLMMIVISLASIISFVPYYIVNIAVKQKTTSSEQEFSVGIQIALRSFILNNAINPYIIGLFNTKFRKFVKSMLCKCFRKK